MALRCIPLILLSILVTSCGYNTDPDLIASKMTATEVCQYVDQRLPDEYEYQAPRLRYEYSYHALSAEYVGEGFWLIIVRETTQCQQTVNDQWMPRPGTSPETKTIRYYLNENTGKLLSSLEWLNRIGGGMN